MKTGRAIKMILLTAVVNGLVYGQMERSQVEDRYKWNLRDLYDSDDAWAQAKAKVTAEYREITRYRGRLAESPAVLRECLDFNSNLNKEFNRLWVYAQQSFDLDTRDPIYQAKVQELQQAAAEIGALSAFIEPEILQIDAETLERFLREERGLAVYEFYLRDLLRKKAHRLSEGEERILAESSRISGAAHDIYSIFTNAELPYPTVTLSTGEQVKLTSAGFAKHRAAANLADRELVFREFFGALQRFQSTLGTSLATAVNSHIFYAKSRRYDSCLAAALDANNIPLDVYYRLIDNVNANLPSFHRYLDIKRRLLGVDELKYSDMYAPTVAGIDLKYSIEEAYALVLQALAPLGSEYVATVKKAMEERWIDVYPTVGKRSGAYSSGDAYDVHPFILLNFNGAYNDVSTLAHELGHTMHSYYSNKHQPYPLANYPIFVAEVASTFNEALLIEYMLKTIRNDDTRLSLLMEYLDGLKGTVFRQTQFAEFELRIHELAERGEALTGETLTRIYGDIFRKYYGHDKGVCRVDDLYAYEWAYIPHFYYNFYVYQYSTSFTASTALAERVLRKEKNALEKYLQFISAGGSDYPIELLKKAGVDMTTSEPFNQTMAKMNRVMDEIDKILKKKGI
ncbi:MAG: oligoendopeptidase F [candidate division KSB1 bacterium]|nr:oligoendopeptidase F [candidate division KSB1 bacterium]